MVLARRPAFLIFKCQHFTVIPYVSCRLRTCGYFYTAIEANKCTKRFYLVITRNIFRMRKEGSSPSLSQAEGALTIAISVKT